MLIDLRCSDCDINIFFFVDLSTFVYVTIISTEYHIPVYPRILDIPNTKPSLQFSTKRIYIRLSTTKLYREVVALPLNDDFIKTDVIPFRWRRGKRKSRPVDDMTSKHVKCREVLWRNLGCGQAYPLLYLALEHLNFTGGLILLLGGKQEVTLIQKIRAGKPGKPVCYIYERKQDQKLSRFPRPDVLSSVRV